MSLPPEVLRIKRKRTDEPIDALYIETGRDDTGKKRRLHHKDFVFKRQAEQNTTAKSTSGIPQILATQPGDEKKSEARDNRSRDEHAPNGEANTEVNEAKANNRSRRQFHLSRPSVASTTGKRKQQIEPDDDVAVVVEGPARRQKTTHQPTDSAEKAAAASRETNGTSTLKRPGAASRLPPPGKEAQKQPSRALEGFLQKAMLRYAAEVDDQHYVADMRARHAELEKQADASTEDVSMLDGEEGDYVYDTFVRHSTEPSALSQNGTHADAERVGYLIIDEEDQELWEMYADDDQESEKDWDSEQDDENAENFYGADYPEDEVDFEDEFDEDPYRYRKGGASDEEEFDENDAWSDEEIEAYGSKSGVLHGKSDTLRTPLEFDDDVDNLV